MAIAKPKARPKAAPSIEQRRAVYRRMFRNLAPRFVMTEKGALHAALRGVVSDDVQHQISRLLRPLLGADRLTEEMRLDMEDAARVIVSLARVHRRDIAVAQACADALTGLGRLMEIGDIAAGRVDPPGLPAA